MGVVSIITGATIFIGGQQAQAAETSVQHADAHPDQPHRSLGGIFLPCRHRPHRCQAQQLPPIPVCKRLRFR